MDPPIDRHERAARTQQGLLSILDQIENLLHDVREVVIDGDPTMNETLHRKAESDDDPRA